LAFSLRPPDSTVLLLPSFHFSGLHGQLHRVQIHLWIGKNLKYLTCLQDTAGMPQYHPTSQATAAQSKQVC